MKTVMSWLFFRRSRVVEMPVLLLESDFSPYQRLEDYQAQCVRPGENGAAVSFVGTLRDMHDDQVIEGMTIECYPDMALKEIATICEEATDQWLISDSLVIHRYGNVDPGDTLVLVAVWSTHRQQAFDACRYIIHYLKHKAPFWKQEKTSQGQHWVATNTEDQGVVSC